MFMPIADPSISLEENTKIAAKQNEALMSFPEVAYAVAKVARADTSTDPAPLEHDGDRRPSEAARAVAPGHDARSPSRGDGSRRSAARRLDHLDDADHQPHRHADHRHSVRSRREGLWQRSSRRWRSGPGASRRWCVAFRARATSIPEQVTSGQYLNIEVDRSAAARYGIGVGDIQQVIESAVGETVLTTTIEGRERFPVRVRYRAAGPSGRAGVGAGSGCFPAGHAGPAWPTRAHQARAWPRHDLVRERAAPGDRAPERPGTRRGRIRGRSAATESPATWRCRPAISSSGVGAGRTRSMRVNNSSSCCQSCCW